MRRALIVLWAAAIAGAFAACGTNAPYPGGGGRDLGPGGVSMADGGAYPDTGADAKDAGADVNMDTAGN